MLISPFAYRVYAGLFLSEATVYENSFTFDFYSYAFLFIFNWDCRLAQFKEDEVWKKNKLHLFLSIILP